MNTKYQIQIKTHNWEGGSPIITKDIVLNDFAKFGSLVEAINKNAGKQVWNWFGKGLGLPDKWDGKNKEYVLDEWKIRDVMDVNFDYKVENINLIKEFYKRFTPNGCDGIEYIKVFKVEEIEL